MVWKLVIDILKGASKAPKKVPKTPPKEVPKSSPKETPKEAPKTTPKDPPKQDTPKAPEKPKATDTKQGPSPPNTGLNTYLDKAMNKLSKFCQKAVKKHNVHIHGRKGEVITPGSKTESDHIIQNAMLEEARGKGSAICPEYKASRGPSMPVGEKAHKTKTKDQRTNSKVLRDQGKQPTYDEAREMSKKQIEKMGIGKRDAECIMKFTDEVFRQLCPDLVDKNQKMRTPKR
jgi:hypothetical protein